MLKTLFLVILFALFCASAFGQAKPEKIDVTYDRFKDRTTVETDYMRVAGSDWNSNPLEIAARFTYPGKTVSKPQYVILFFYSATKTWRFKTAPTLIALVDGESLDLGRATLTDQDIHTDTYSVSVREYLAAVIPFDTFLKIKNARTVEMQLGTTEFRLNEKVLVTFRELATRAR